MPPALGREQADAQAFYDDAPCGYVTMQCDGTVLAANRTLLGWTGTGGVAARRLRFGDMMTRSSWAVFSMKCLPALAMGRCSPELAFEIRRPDGSALPVLGSFRSFHGTEDRPTIRGILLDATERRLYERDLLSARTAAEDARRVAEDARRRAEQVGAQLSTVLDSTTDGVLLVGPDWRISYANPQARSLGTGPLAGQDLRHAFAWDRGGIFLDAFRRAMRGEPGEAVEAMPHASTWLWVRADPTPGGGMAVFFRDVTQQRLATEERQRHAERVEHMASHDALTGLANRRLFAARLREALTAGGGPIAVMCLDLDRFKQVNDALGHPTGDLLLQAVAGRLRRALRPGDTVARFGGDEFAILLPPAPAPDGAPTEDRAEALAARLVRRLGAAYAIGGKRVEIGASIGITLGAPPAAEPDAQADALLAEADLALYEAKRAGRGRHAVFHPAMMAAQRSRLDLGDALRRAITGGELLLHHQPVVEVPGRTVCGYEALVRWNRPGHGLVPPASFIPIAEASGLILPLGAFVLEQACHDAAAWPDQACRVAVNISPLQLRDAGLVDIVAQALERSGLAPARLELEITEGVLLDRTEEVLAQMHRLREIGIGFALDDFGTGFSSLSTLRAFPFGRVKIDRSFLHEAETRDADAAIVQSVAALAGRLGMGCVAEGIETEGQFRLVAEVGCAEAQGWLLGRPMPQAEVLRRAGWTDHPVGLSAGN